MTKTLTDIGSARPLLDIASYARRGPGQRDRLSREEIALIVRTVRRTPEVMVKVLTRGGQNMKAVRRHFSYLSRKGNLAIETDDGQEIQGKDAEAALLKDWDLDIQEQRPTSLLGPGLSHKAPKLVHKVLFSMPPGTPPVRVFEAVKAFAREEFGSKYRYAMVLHTDEPHPHVHMVVKSVSEQGVRLNVRKAVLREWRREFARHLRTQGVAANATARAVRGSIRPSMKDGAYRVAQRNDPWRFTRPRAVTAAPASNRMPLEARETKSLGTREQVARGWHSLGDALHAEGHAALAAKIRDFVACMPSVRTDQSVLSGNLTDHVRESPDNRDRAMR